MQSLVRSRFAVMPARRCFSGGEVILFSLFLSSVFLRVGILDMLRLLLTLLLSLKE